MKIDEVRGSKESFSDDPIFLVGYETMLLAVREQKMVEWI